VSIQYCAEGVPDVDGTCLHYCGGTIISPSWIVTTGSCFTELMYFKIFAGSLNLYELDSDIKQSSEIRQTILHPDYDGGRNDIRLIQLTTPLELNERVQPVKLPEQNSTYVGDVVVSGWGITEDDNDPFAYFSDTLQYLTSNMPDVETCLQLANAAADPNPFDVTSNVCSVNSPNNHGVCEGDIGGPVTQNGTLVGIVSWYFEPCGSLNAPSVYTKVSNYIDWIRENVPELQGNF